MTSSQTSWPATSAGLPPATRLAIQAMLVLGANRSLDALVQRRMRRDLLTAWGVAQGKHVFGVRTPHEYLAATKRWYFPHWCVHRRLRVQHFAAGLQRRADW